MIRTHDDHRERSLTGSRVRPIMIDVNYCVDIDTLVDFDLAERAIEQKQLDIDVPQARRRSRRCEAGRARSNCWYSTSTACSPTIGSWFWRMAARPWSAIAATAWACRCCATRDCRWSVLSTEVNPVVDARCRKLKLECQHGLADKRAALVAAGAG